MAKYLKEVLKGVKSSTKVTNDLGGYKPKAGDEEDFAKKHEIEKHADRVGNGDDIYKGTTKHVLADKKEKNHGYKKPEDIKVNESKKAEDVSHNVDSVEHPLNELSTDLLHRAANKAAKVAMTDVQGRSGPIFKKRAAQANKFRAKGMEQEKQEKAAKIKAYRADRDKNMEEETIHESDGEWHNSKDHKPLSHWPKVHAAVHRSFSQAGGGGTDAEKKELGKTPIHPDHHAAHDDAESDSKKMRKAVNRHYSHDVSRGLKEETIAEAPVAPVPPKQDVDYIAKRYGRFSHFGGSPGESHDYKRHLKRLSKQTGKSEKVIHGEIKKKYSATNEEAVDESYGSSAGKTATGTKWSDNSVSVSVHHDGKKHTFTGKHDYVAKKLKAAHGIGMHQVNFKKASDMKEATDPRDSRPETYRKNNTGYAWDKLSTRSPSNPKDSKATKTGKQLGLKYSIKGALGSHGPKGKLPEETVEEGAKVDRMVSHIKSSEKAAGKSDKKAESIAWATANKRGMLDNKNKKVEESDTPITFPNKQSNNAVGQNV